MQETLTPLLSSPLSEPLFQCSCTFFFSSIQQQHLLLALSKDIMIYLYQPFFLGLEKDHEPPN